MGGENTEAPNGGTKFGCEKKQRNGMLTRGAGISKKKDFFSFLKWIRY